MLGVAIMVVGIPTLYVGTWNSFSLLFLIVYTVSHDRTAIGAKI